MTETAYLTAEQLDRPPGSGACALRRGPLVPERDAQGYATGRLVRYPICAYSGRYVAPEDNGVCPYHQAKHEQAARPFYGHFHERIVR